MLSVDDAKQLAAVWRPRFKDESDFEASWARYMDTATVPDVGRLEAWLAKDLDRSEVKQIGAPHEPLLPQLSRYDLNGCYHCYGRGWVRIDSDIPQQPQRCPACHGRDGDQSSHCAKCADFWVKQTDAPERNQCFKCRQYEDEPAGESCTNPVWHIPHGQATGATPDDVVRRF